MAEQYFAVERHKFQDFHLVDDQFDALEACLTGETSIEDAVKRLTAHVEASPTPAEMQQRIGALWELLNRTAVKLHSSQNQIISILQTIQTLPKAEAPKGEGEDHLDFDDGYFWRDLTDWGDDWFDQWNTCAVALWHYTPKGHEDLEARKTLMIGGYKFQARLSATENDKLSSKGHGIIRASSIIVDALEVEGEDKPTDAIVQSAAQLFLYAAPQIYRLCREGHGEGLYHNIRKDPKKRSDLWEGADGFSKDRWKLWKERWAVLADRDRFSEEARVAAKEALKAMKATDIAS